MRRIHVSFSFPWPFSPTETRELTSFTFKVAWLNYLGLLLLENLQPGFVSRYHQLNTFLWIAIVIGIVSAVWPMVVPEARTRQVISRRSAIWLSVFSLVTIGMVWLRTPGLGSLRLLISLIAGALVYGLGWMTRADSNVHVDNHHRPE